MPRGLAGKLILSLTIVVVVVESISTYLNINIQRQQHMDEMTRDADRISKTIVSSTWLAMLEDRKEIAYQIMHTIGRQVGIDKVRFFNKEGRITFSTGHDKGDIVDKNAEACYLCHARELPLVRIDVPSRMRIFEASSGERMMGMVTPIYNDQSCSQAACHAHPEQINVLGVLDINMSLSRMDAEIAGMRNRAIWFSIVSFVLLSVAIFCLSNRLVARPVGKLIAATKSVAALNLDKPIQITARDELGVLADSFNRMREHLKESRAKEAEFTHTLEQKVQERTQQLRLAEQRLIQADKLASMGQLAASVAHEINNPLQGVLNFAKLMQRILTDAGVPPERVADFRKYLKSVIDETTRSGRIVTDLLAFSRRSSPQMTPCRLNDIVERTLSVVGHKLELSGVKTRLALADDIPELVCDSSQIQQILINLVMNSAEAMEQGGTIDIRTFRNGPCIFLEVQDDGPGIPAENQEKIFDPFFSTKEAGKGVGLGLSVLYGIVNAHGGQVSVSSEVGKGATFTVRLPMDASRHCCCGE